MIMRFSGLLLRLVGYERLIEIEAADLGGALTEVEQRFPALKGILRDEAGEVRRTHRIFINGELTPTANHTTPLTGIDHVEFVTAIAGG